MIIYFIDKQTDVQKFVELFNACYLPSDNRTIMIYKKGQKDGPNRDSIILPFKNNGIMCFLENSFVGLSSVGIPPFYAIENILDV